MAYPTSGRFDPALRVAHEVVCYAEVWRGPVRITLPDGSTQLKVIDGTVTVDELSKVRRTLTMTIGNVDLAPVQAPDPNVANSQPGTILSPVYADVRPYLGVRYTEGDTEVIPLGVFRIDFAGQSNFRAGVQIRASDYSKVLADARFLGPWATPAGSRVTDEIARMATDALPLLTVVDLTGSLTQTTASSWARDRWDSMTKLATSIGAECFFDQVGRLVIRYVPQVSAGSVPVWTVDAASPSSVLTDFASGVSSDKVFNIVVASSSASGINVSAAAFMTTGPFAYQYATGFRFRPKFYASPVLTTVNQCFSAAQSILARSAILSRSISPIAAPNPALDVGDVVTVTVPAPPTGQIVDPSQPAPTLSETRIVTKIVLPLKPGPMTLETRIRIDAGMTTDVGSFT